MDQSKGNLYFTTIIEAMSNLREKSGLIKNITEQLNVKTAGRSFGAEQQEIIQLKQQLDTIKREYIVITYNIINDLNSIDRMESYLSLKQQKILFDISGELQTFYIPNIKLMEKNSGQTSEFYQSSPYFASSGENFDNNYGSDSGNYDQNYSMEMKGQTYESQGHLALREQKPLSRGQACSGSETARSNLVSQGAGYVGSSDSEHYLVSQGAGYVGSSDSEHYNIDFRNQQMRELQAEAEMVKHLFNKVAELVNDQGDMVNNFDTHITMASDNAHRAVEELREADNSKKNNRKCCCIVGTFIGVFVFVIIVVGIIILVNPSENKN